MVSKKNQTLMFVVLYVVHYFNMAIMGSQRLTFLIDVGYSQSDRALIYALIPVVSIIFQFLFGYLSDKYKTVRKLLLVLLIGSMISGFIFYNIFAQIFAYHLILAVLSSACIGSMTELHDIWIFNSQDGQKVKFSFVRSFGSFGWAIGCIAVSLFVGAFGFSSLALVGTFISFVQLIFVMILKDIDSDKSIKRAPVKLRDLGGLFKSSNYRYAMLVLFTMNFAANICGFIIIDKILMVGGDAYQIGLRGMIAAGVEMPLFLLGDQVARKLGFSKMLIIGTIIYTLQYVFYALSTNSLQMILITLPQCIGVPMYVVGIKNIIVQNSPENYKASGQMIGPAIMNGVGAIFAPLASSFIAQRWGINAPLVLATFLGIIAVFASLRISKVRAAYV